VAAPYAEVCAAVFAATYSGTMVKNLVFIKLLVYSFSKDKILQNDAPVLNTFNIPFRAVDDF
jgi:hypothetical protein